MLKAIQISLKLVKIFKRKHNRLKYFKISQNALKGLKLLKMS